ncbi:MAG: hypothetical protein M3Z41_02235 [Candidatus Eremiobacteraeota bacterium]|nr:hypothetical protein [Candidatus Eremiobacteraeota bacterium]
MWTAIITSAATIAAVLYMQGPIVALCLTALSSLVLLIVLRAAENRPNYPKPQPRPLEGINPTSEIDLLFPPLQQEAS